MHFSLVLTVLRLQSKVRAKHTFVSGAYLNSTMKSLLPFFASLIVAIAPAFAQNAPPATDLYLLPLPEDLTTLQANAAHNITDRPNYDNQPHFIADGAHILYTSYRTDGQTDIFRYTLASRQIHPVTRTVESEYSPTPLPSGDGFSVIQVEADGTQRLWQFDHAGQNLGLIFENIQPVGYHVWGDATNVVMFVLGNPMTLQRAATDAPSPQTLANNIGRSLHKIPGESAISFVEKHSDTEWTIQSLDLATNAIAAIAPTLPNREDYAWHPAGILLMADGSILYRRAPSDDAWQPLADFSSHGISTITRLAMHPEGRYLAFVADH